MDIRTTRLNDNVIIVVEGLRSSSKAVTAVLALKVVDRLVQALRRQFPLYQVSRSKIHIHDEYSVVMVRQQHAPVQPVNRANTETRQIDEFAQGKLAEILADELRRIIRRQVERGRS
ncbi:MAG TPA: hypothetical protein VF597_03350 [Candidatus Saccharimonadales bacterium]